MTRAIGKGFKAWIEFADYPRCGKRRDAVAQTQENKGGYFGWAEQQATLRNFYNRLTKYTGPFGPV